MRNFFNKIYTQECIFSTEQNIECHLIYSLERPNLELRISKRVQEVAFWDPHFIILRLIIQRSISNIISYSNVFLC